MPKCGRMLHVACDMLSVACCIYVWTRTSPRPIRQRRQLPLGCWGTWATWARTILAPRRLHPTGAFQSSRFVVLATGVCQQTHNGHGDSPLPSRFKRVRSMVNGCLQSGHEGGECISAQSSTQSTLHHDNKPKASERCVSDPSTKLRVVAR